MASIDEAVAPSTSGAAFVRQASGLVRLGTPWRIMVMVVLLSGGIGVFMSEFYLEGPGTFPHMNLLLAVVVCCVPQLGFCAVYAFLAGAMPRSGGEYIYISRVFGPFYGFVINVGAYVALCFYSAVTAFLTVTVALSPIASTYGVITDSHSALSLGTWFASPDHAILVAAAFVVGSAILVCFGMRTYYRVQAATWWVGMACFVALLILMAVNSHGSFVHALNTFGAKSGGGPNVFAAVTAAARKAGVASGYTFGATVSMAAFLTLVSVTGYIGGEVRTPLRTQMIGMVGGATICAVIFFVAPLLIAHLVGLGWNKDASVIALSGKSPLSQSPVLTFYGLLLTSSPVVLLVIGFGLVILTVVMVPQNMIMCSRMIFAWSFDRLVPRQLANINRRTGAPLTAVVVSAVIILVLVILYGKGKIGYFNPILLVGVVWAAVGVTGVMFPFRKRAKRQWEDAPAAVRTRIGPLPLITVLGAISVVWYALAIYLALSIDALGANKTSNLVFCGITFLAPMAYFGCVYAYRRREGFNMAATFAELPPD